MCYPYFKIYIAERMSLEHCGSVFSGQVNDGGLELNKK